MLEIGIGYAPEVEYDRLGVKGRAVVKNNILAQLEGIGFTIGRNLPGSGELRDQRRYHALLGTVAVDQAFENLQYDPLIAAAENHMRIIPGNFALNAVNQGPSVFRGLSADRADKYQRYHCSHRNQSD